MFVNLFYSVIKMEKKTQMIFLLSYFDPVFNRNNFYTAVQKYVMEKLNMYIYLRDVIFCLRQTLDKSKYFYIPLDFEITRLTCISISWRIVSKNQEN